MSDDKTSTAQDRKLISLEEGYEIRDWTKAFGCSEEELRKAVALVGHSASAVRDYLRKTK